eukprot:3329026-Pleurochrysis_carterae.AAC.1
MHLRYNTAARKLHCLLGLRDYMVRRQHAYNSSTERIDSFVARTAASGMRRFTCEVRQGVRRVTLTDATASNENRCRWQV